MSAGTTAAMAPDSVPEQASTSLVWVTCSASVLLILALLLANQGTLVRLVIPAAATLVGLTFYFRSPAGYFHFTLWIWFLIPLIRRIVDWRVGFADHNLVLATPLLVSAIAGLTLLREGRTAGAARLAPFFLCIAGMFYGLGVGLLRWRLHASDGASLGEIFYALMDWLAPLLFGLHLYLRWPQYEEHKHAIQKSLLWAVLLLGGYGIYQCVRPPIWDTLWLEHMMSDLGAEAFGRPEPFQIRVWSTLNSPGVFGNLLVAGLLMLFSIKSRMKPLAAAVGYPAFLLTLVRASWLGWLLGLLVMARSSKGRQVQRLLLSVILLPVLLAPLMLNPEIASIVTDRLKTFQSTGQDQSFQDRAAEYRELLTRFTRDPFGEGLSNAETAQGYTMDSGIIQLFYFFGWLGAALYLLGIVLCARRIFSGQASDDPIAAPCRAAFAAMVFEQLSGNTFIGASGLILWTCIGLTFSLRQIEQVSPSLPKHTAPFNSKEDAEALFA
jgi:hypothetical protein